MAWLVALDPNAPRRRFPLEAACLIGRGALNHIVIDDVRISRQHAKITPEEDGHVVIDLGSANGTFVNDAPVKRARLAHNDVLRVGPFRFAFEDAGVGAVPRARTPIPFGAGLEVKTRGAGSGLLSPAKIIEAVDAIAVDAAITTAGLTELEDADRKLRTLYAFMQSVSSTLDAGELATAIVNNLLTVFPSARRVAVYLRDELGEMAPRAAGGREEGTSLPAPLPVAVISEVVQNGRAILSQPFLPPARTGQTPIARLSMHAPMISRGVALGVLEVQGVDATSAPLGQRDLDLLNALAALAAMALHATHLHAESLRRERLAKDLDFAREIQKSFLPRALPPSTGASEVDVAARYEPAFQVGGDFYDFFWLDDAHLGLFVGDVSGKGVSAALLMARMSSDLRVALLAEGQPGPALARLNKSLLAHDRTDVFLTGVCLVLEVATGRALLANAGHLPPIVRRQGGIEELLGGGATAIGIFPDEPFPQVFFELGPGESIVLATDGVLEAANLAGEQLGFARMNSAIEATPIGASADELADALLGAVSAHTAGAPSHDDVTVLVCTRPA